MKLIKLLPIISIISNFVINSVHALPPDGCNMTLSSVHVDYGNITSNILYNEAEKTTEGFILTRTATLEILCDKRKNFQIELRSDKAEDRDYFNAGYNSIVSIIADKIQTNAKSQENITFSKARERYKLDAQIEKEWFPGQLLQSNRALSKLTVQMKIKLLIPHSIVRNEIPLNFQTALNFLLISKIKSPKKNTSLRPLMKSNNFTKYMG
ncbi:MAG: hypothetical protein ACEY3I_02575 [Arsenophonus sp.]